MNLNTGKLLSRYQWTELPISDSVIRAVNERGKNDRKIKEGDTIPEMFEFSIRDKDGVISPISDSQEEVSQDDVPPDLSAPPFTPEVDAIIHPDDIDENPKLSYTPPLFVLHQRLVKNTKQARGEYESGVL